MATEAKKDELLLYLSLFAIQGKGLKVTKDETANAGAYSYNYASLEAVWKVLRPELESNLLVVVQTPERDDLVTTVYHVETGDSITGTVPLITAAESKNHMQDLGGAITYARRYALTSMFNIVTDDDDNASNTKDAAVRRASTTNSPSSKQLDLARDLLTKARYSKEAIDTRLASVRTSAEASSLIDKLFKLGGSNEQGY